MRKRALRWLFVSLRADGEREFMFYRHPSADMMLTPEEIDVEAIRSAKLLHFGSISLISEPSRSATMHAVATARDADCWVSYDPNLRLALWPNKAAAREGLRRGLAAAQIVKISEEEVEFLTGTSDLDKGKEALWHDALQLLVITRGRAGCIFFYPGTDGQ